MPNPYLLGFFALFVVLFVVCVIWPPFGVKSRDYDSDGGSNGRANNRRQPSPRLRTSYFIRWITDAQKTELRNHGVHFTESNLGKIKFEIAQAAAAAAAAEAARIAAEEEAARQAALLSEPAAVGEEAPEPSPPQASDEPALVAVPVPVTVEEEVFTPDPDEDGILIDENELEDLLEALSCSVAGTADSGVALPTGPIHEVVIYADATDGNLPFQLELPRNLRDSNRIRGITVSLLAEKLQGHVAVHFGAVQTPSDDGVFRVYFNNAVDTSEAAEKVVAPAKIWGFPIGDGQQSAYKASGRGDAIVGPDGFVLAELVGFNLYIHFEPFSADFEAGAAIYARILQKLQPHLALDKLLESVVRAADVASAAPSGDARTTVAPMPNDHVGRIAETLRILCDRVLVPQVGMNVAVRNGGNRAILPDSLRPSGAFHLILGSSPLGRVHCPPPKTLFGLSNDHRDREKTFAPSGMGIPIFDDGGYVIAELVGDALYVHADVMRLGSLPEARIFVRLLKAICAAHADRQKPQDVRERETQEQFIRTCLEQIVPLTSPGLHCDQVKLANSQRDMHESLLQARADEHALFQLEAAPDEEIGLEYDRLLDIANVLDVKVNDHKLTVTTDVLFCRNPDTGQLHEIGAFDIQIPTEGGDVRWNNKTRKVSAYQEGMNAPHVFADGHACLGNVADLFPRLIEMRDYASCVQVAIAFVEAVNTSDSAGRHIEAWPLARDFS